MVQYFCGGLYFTRYYHLHTWKFLYSLCNKVEYFKEFVAMVELERHRCGQKERMVATRIPLK